LEYHILTLFQNIELLLFCLITNEINQKEKIVKMEEDF